MFNPFTHPLYRQRLRTQTNAIAIIAIEAALSLGGLLLASGILKDEPIAKTATVLSTALIVLASAATIHVNTAAETREHEGRNLRVGR